MLEKLLAEIQAGGTLEVNTLARKLNASPQLITLMLEHLQRAGHLRPYQQACESGCEACSLQGDCIHLPAPKLWSSR